MTTREPGSEGKCATEGGTIQHHLYDEANRLTDEGIEYEALGNTTKLPAADAGGKEMTSSFYVDGQAATQEQNGVQDKYTYDSAGRTMETTAENIATKAIAATVSHYAGPGEAITWTSQGEEKWSRNIPGIDGSLQATEESTKVVTLQLTDLQGNIVATAADNETETKLLTTDNSTEFGEPSEGKTPPKYAWLGANGLATEIAFGTGIATQGGASYVPQVARDLQTAPVTPPGAFPELAPGTQYTATVSPGSLASAQEEATRLWQQAEAERQKQREREAEEAWADSDPHKEGLLTGQEAREWGEYMQTRAELLAARTSEQLCEGEEAYCELLEEHVKEDEKFSDTLEWCGKGVGKGHNLNHGGKTYFVTQTCWVEVAYEELDGYIAVTSYKVKMCKSEPWTKHGDNEWYCEYDKKWWGLKDRGWWENT